MAEPAEWVPLGSRNLQKFKVYDMKWYGSVALDNVTVAVAPFGGHIALANNLDESGTAKRQFAILIYTASGQLIGRSQWKNGEILHMGWTCTEDLVCIQTDGRVFTYSLFGLEREAKRFSMGQDRQFEYSRIGSNRPTVTSDCFSLSEVEEAQEMKIIECQMFDSYSGTGIAVLTSAFRFFLINNVEEPKLWRAAEVIGKTPSRPNCWTVISKDRQTKVLAVYGAEMYFLGQGQSAELIVPAFETPVKQYIAVSLSPDKESLAFLSENGAVQVGSSDLRRSVCECDSGYRGFKLSGPLQFLWCGNDAVALVHDGNCITVVGLEGESVQFAFDSTIGVTGEVDGLRIVSGEANELLGAVPKPIQDILSVGSMSSSALLFEASKEYANKSYKSYDYLRMIESHLPEAVRECIEAAAHEYSTSRQKLLLEAASFGKTFCPDMESETFVCVCRELRVLNALRDRLLAIPLTYPQFKALTQNVLVDRLINRCQWPMAISACEYLRVEPREGVERVVAHWALRKLHTSRPSSSIDDDRLLAKQICEKFSKFPGISYADMAEKAADFGRKELAALLLENEPQLVRQVLMLMKLNQNEKALSRATESGDPDLIHSMILHLRKTMEKKGDLELILRNFPTAFTLYKRYCEAENPQLLKALYRQTDDFVSQGICCLKEAGDSTLFDVREKIDNLKEAEQCFRQAKDDFACAQIADHSKLLTHQAKFEEQFGYAFVDRSLRETIVWLIEHSEHSKAEALRKEFKLSDKQFWRWKVEALAKSGQWTELEALGKSKKSPIGYLPFIESCMQYGQVDEARKYLVKLAADEKVKGLVKMDLLEEATKLAAEQKDEYGLDCVLKRCGPRNRGLSERIHEIKAQLASAGKRK